MAKQIPSFLKSKAFLYIVFLILATPYFIQLFDQPWTHRQYNHFLHETGQWSARFLIITLMISPILILFPENSFLKWMRKRKRVFGISTFIFSSIHLVGYFVENNSWSLIFNDLNKPMVLFGWFAYLIFLPLAITSNNISMRWMTGKNWKNVQRFVYIAAISIAIHWFWGERHLNWIPVLIHFLPLMILEVYRVHHYLVSRST